jgi:hypothetical protein
LLAAQAQRVTSVLPARVRISTNATVPAHRAGVVPEAVCERCNDIWATPRGAAA